MHLRCDRELLAEIFRPCSALHGLHACTTGASQSKRGQAAFSQSEQSAEREWVAKNVKIELRYLQTLLVVRIVITIW